ncbi:MAG: NAD(P)/FAD-dependent oxidoreductase [Arenimonas sp.]
MAIGQTTYYRASAPVRPSLAPLSGRREARVCIVGGGFAGLNTALGLAERGMRDVVVVEAREIAHGAAGRNGGFVFAGFSRGPARLLRDLGRERARALYGGTVDAVNLIRKRIHDHAIACDPTDAGVYWANWFRDPKLLHAHQAMLADAFDAHWRFVPREQFRELVRSERYHDALFEPNALHFHPLAYAHGLAAIAGAQGVSLHEHSPAVALDRHGAAWRVTTPGGVVEAEQVVLACGGYLAGLRREIDAGVLPIATYVMATEPLGERLADALRTPAAVYDTRFAFDYYRPLPDTRLLWGGRISVLDRSPDAVRKLLLRDLLRVFPQLRGVRVESAWSGLMSYARHEMPQIGVLEPGLWFAQAFGGHGVAPTTFAGEVLAAAIAEGDERWKQFAAYGLVSAFKPLAYLGAQLSYWGYACADWVRERT